MTSIRACLLTASLAAVGVAQAQTAPPPPPVVTTKADDSSLTWKGITLYGILDLGIQYDTHSAPFSDYFPATSASLVQKNDYDSPTGLTSNNLSQSRIGISGNEPIGGDWAAVFRLETFFNPTTGTLSDALKSVALNNGKPCSTVANCTQSVGVDSSVAGQLFAGAAYVGVSSPTYGTFTFGRNVTLLADGIAKYDPMGAAQAFSLIGFSGTAAGGGDTEDRRLDQSLKYYAKYDFLHFGALYQFSGNSGSTNTGFQFELGAEYAGFSIDGYYQKKYDAIAVASLSAAQVAAIQTGNCAAAPPAVAQCWPIGSSLAATVSDNETYSFMALYAIPDTAFKVSAGYERITFNNPNDPLAPGSLTIGGYVLAVTNNTAYVNQKVLEVYWAGAKFGVTPNFDITAAYYGYSQNAFATGANAGCTTKASSGCSGSETALSLLLDYRLSKRFDTYLGTMYSGVQNGLANGFLFSTNIATTAGVRFRF